MALRSHRVGRGEKVKPCHITLNEKIISKNIQETKMSKFQR